MYHMFKYNALTSLRQYLWLYPTRNTVRMLRVELVFTMINGLKRMTDQLFTYVAIRYYYVVSRLKRHFSLSRRTKLNQKKKKIRYLHPVCIQNTFDISHDL